MFIGGLATLIAGGEILVRGATGLAVKFHISTLVIGLTVVAFSTSAPELLVCVQAVLKGLDDIAIGNVVGSNIANLGLVLGLTAMIFPIVVAKDSIRINWPVMMGASVAFYLCTLDGDVNRLEGTLFIISIIVFTVLLIRKARKEGLITAEAAKERDVGMSDEEREINQQKGKSLKFIVSLLFMGSLALAFGAEWFVKGAANIAGSFGVSERIIGLTAVAFGTSMPELITSVVAALKKETDIAIGNLVGSNIFNILSILGITSLVKEIYVAPEIMSSDMYWMLAISFIIFPMMITRKQIGRVEGAILFITYCTYIYFLF